MTVLAAICLIVVMAFLALAVDWGYLAVTESELQNAADAGALSGARGLTEGRDAAIAAAQLWASKNMAAGQSVGIVAGEDVEIGRWDDETGIFTQLSAGAPDQPNAVRVTCRRSTARGNPLNLFFAPVLGRRSANLSATATAKLERNVCGMFVGIQSVDVQNAEVDSYDSTLGSYGSQSPGNAGDVCSDGAITFSPGGFVHGDASLGPDGSVSDPSKVSGSIQQRSRPIRWQPIDTSGPAAVNDNAQLPGSHLTNGGRRLVVEGSSVVVLPPGTYYLPDGMRTAGSAQIVITGPTRFVLGGTVEITGGGIVNQTALPANLRLEVTSTSMTISGNAEVHADIYAPTAQVSVSGNPGFYGAIFAQRIAMNGTNARLHADTSLREEFDQYTSTSSLRD